MYPNVYSSTFNNSQIYGKSPNVHQLDEWIKKMWFIYTMEYYLAMRKNEILPFATTWLDLEGIMLSEISQRKIDICFHSYVELEKLNRRPWGKGRGKNSFREGGKSQETLIIEQRERKRTN